MSRLAQEEKADLFVPVTSPVASQYEARVASVLPEGCHSWALSPSDTDDLDDKVNFCQSAAHIGLTVPHALRMCSPEQVRAFNKRLRALEGPEPIGAPAGGGRERYILKSLNYDSMHRLDLFTLPVAPAALDAYLA